MTPDKIREHHEFYRRRLLMTPSAEGGGWGMVYGLAMQMCIAAIHEELVAYRDPTPEERAKMPPTNYLVGMGWPNPHQDAPPELWPADLARLYGINPRYRRSGPDREIA